MPVSSSVGFFTTVQNDVWFCFLLRAKWHEVPIGDKSTSYFVYALYDALKNAPTAILQSARKFLFKIT